MGEGVGEVNDKFSKQYRYYVYFDHQGSSIFSGLHEVSYPVYTEFKKCGYVVKKVEKEAGRES
jgi:hypothetical protein